MFTISTASPIQASYNEKYLKVGSYDVLLIFISDRIFILCSEHVLRAPVVVYWGGGEGMELSSCFRRLQKIHW